MTESISFQQLRVVEDILRQIQEAIRNLELWNKEIADVNVLLTSPGGMKTLAADCMLLEAIGEGIKSVDERTKGLLLVKRPEIPWKAVKGMRDRIAHGYFDINTELVWDAIKNDLPALSEAINYLVDNLYGIISFEDN